MKNTAKLLAEVQNLIEKKKYNEANEILSEDILESLNDVNLYIEKSIILGNLEKYGESKLNAEKAKDLDPKSIKAYYYIGRVYLRLKDYNKAIESYNKAIEIDSKDSISYEGLASVYVELKNYEEAIRFYEKSLELYPSNIKACNG